MNEWESFDRELTESLTDLPPTPETARAVTPWKSAMGHILAGLCLTCFTLNVWYLQYLLPTLGAVELYLGFRALRENNQWFKKTYIISICKGTLLYCSFLLQATPFYQSDTLSSFLGWGQTLLMFLLLWWFSLALRGSSPHQRKSDRTPAALAAWYVVLVGLSKLLPDNGWLGAIPMAMVFFCIFRALRRLAEQLDSRTVRVYEFFRLRKNTLHSNLVMRTQLEWGSSGSPQVRDITSAISWTRNGVHFQASLSISQQTYTGILGSSVLPSSLFSYPYFSQERAGYMAYTARLGDSRQIYSSVLRGALSTCHNLYPYVDAAKAFQTDCYAQSDSIFEFRQRPASD